MAETESGRYLTSLFSEYRDQVIPLLRSSSVKYKQPATNNIHAMASLEEADRIHFEEQFLKRGRATITVSVEVRDSNDTITMVGEFTWFIQKT